jgi:hypothetical protein
MPQTTITQSHPDWRSFSNKAAKGVLFTNFAYKQKDTEMQALADSLPEGYELLLMTDHLEDTKEASFRCVAFIKLETKEIIFATAGTRLGFDEKGYHDVMDDALLVSHEKPRKLNPAQILNDMILDSLGNAAKEYKFHYSGHSLGAAMAEMQAADMDIKLTKKGLKTGDKDQVTAITFENPGTKPIIEKMYKEAGLPKEHIKKLNFLEFNNRDNIINSLNKQTGHTYEIIPHSQKERNPTSTQMVFEVVAKYVSELNPLLGKVFSLLAPGGLDSQLIKEHALTNFNEVFVQKAGTVRPSGPIIPLEEAYSGIKPIEYDKKIAGKISETQKAKGSVGKAELSMTKLDPKTKTVDRTIFSKKELKYALGKLIEFGAKKIGDAIIEHLEKRYNQDKSKKETPELKLQSAREVVGQISLRQ